MDRCELTELPADSCAHCTGRTGDSPAESSPAATWTEAQYHGRCTGCSQRILPGDQICADGEGGWLCAGCGH